MDTCTRTTLGRQKADLTMMSENENVCVVVVLCLVRGWRRDVFCLFSVFGVPLFLHLVSLVLYVRSTLSLLSASSCLRLAVLFCLSCFSF